MARPINIESDTDKPRLLKYASSFIDRLVSLFMTYLVPKDVEESGTNTRWGGKSTQILVNLGFRSNWDGGLVEK
jgi:hypothetical protein